MHALVTATKKQKVSRPGPKNTSEIEFKSLEKPFLEASSQKGGSCENICFYGPTHIGRLLESTYVSKNPLRNTARNALEKRLTKERNKTLVGSIWGGSGLKMSPKKLPIELPRQIHF